MLEEAKQNVAQAHEIQTETNDTHEVTRMQEGKVELADHCNQISEREQDFIPGQKSFNVFETSYQEQTRNDTDVAKSVQADEFRRLDRNQRNEESREEHKKASSGHHE